MEEIDKPEMIELSVQMSDLMNYDIMIPKVISANNFSEILKRLKAVHSMLPKEAIILEFKQGTSPLLQLPLEESKELYELYKTTTSESFNEFIKEKYDVELDRNKAISLMGRVKKRNSNLEMKQKRREENV